MRALRLGLLWVAVSAAVVMLSGYMQVATAQQTGGVMPAPSSPTKRPIPPGTQTLVVGGGCFWCIETMFEQLRGVYDVESGYAGGDVKNPTYMMVMSGQTGHAEVIRITYLPREISLDDLLRVFFLAHDPTQLNRQGPDVGTQYRSVVFYENETQKRAFERIRTEIKKEELYDRPIVTTLEKLKNYTRAEEYHQDYYAKFERATPEERAKMNVGYCTYVVSPKVEAFRRKFIDKLWSSTKDQ